MRKMIFSCGKKTQMTLWSLAKIEFNAAKKSTPSKTDSTTVEKCISVALELKSNIFQPISANKA